MSPIIADAALPTRGPQAAQAPPRPKRTRKWEAADGVIAGSMLLVAVIVGIFVLLCFRGYDSTIEGARERAQRAADVVAEGTRWAVGSAIALLEDVADSVADDPSLNGAATLSDFRAVSATIPVEMALGLYDTAGTARAGAMSPGMPASVAETDYFKAVLGGQAWALGRQETHAGGSGATFAVARRLEADGVFIGAAVIAVDDAVLARLAAPQNLGKDSIISLVRADGWLMGRYPPVGEPVDFSDLSTYPTVMASETGSYVSGPSVLDGIVRIVSFRQVEDLGYVAIAAISKEQALAGLWYSILVVSLLIAPIAAALLIGSFVTARILRRTQATSRSLATALEHNDILFREIHHRVKNNLQSISSLMQLQPIPRAIKADMSQRIAAMSAVHEHIYRSANFATVRVKDYLQTLIGNIRAGQNCDVQVIEDIEDVAVDKDAATPLGLIVNEVVSNAFKHAFADGRDGTVHISLVAQGDNQARLTVRDNGVGFDPETPTKGIGRRLINGLAAQLQGEVSQSSDNGSVFVLTFPLAKQ